MKTKNNVKAMDFINKLSPELKNVVVETFQKTKIEAVVGKVYVCPVVTTDYRPAFRFYKVSSKGTFGRVVVETYLSLTTTFDASKLQPYMKGKQVKVSEITTKQVYSI